MWTILWAPQPQLSKNPLLLGSPFIGVSHRRFVVAPIVSLLPDLLQQITIMAAAEDSDPLFADLVTGPGCRIVKTECRALSLTQFQKIIDHITRRLTENGEIWQDDIYENGVWQSQVDLTDPLAVNLYHANAKIIKPATIKQQLSLVELMAEGDQIGDYFTSHWYSTARAVCCSSLHTCQGGASLSSKCIPP